jgi:aquaporin Z
LATAWIYIAGPLAGAAIAVAFEWILKGPPTSSGAIAAQGIGDDTGAMKNF